MENSAGFKMKSVREKSKDRYVIFTQEDSEFPKPLSLLSVHIKQR